MVNLSQKYYITPYSSITKIDTFRLLKNNQTIISTKKYFLYINANSDYRYFNA